MAEPLQKILNLLHGTHWEWQLAFLSAAAVILVLLGLIRREGLALTGFDRFIRPSTGDREAANYGIIFLAGAIAILLLVAGRGIPVPQTHDEFGYLLLADTFLHGHVANPAPVSPEHFQYFHILVSPVYTAKYPPLQGILLAAGKFVFGTPIAGVWLVSILSGLAVYWLLRGRFSPEWSLYGSLIWILSPLNLIWCDSYWGAHAAVIGGALSVGAFLRLTESPRLRTVLVWGAGMFCLLNSRIYEGAVLTAVLIALLGIETIRAAGFSRGVLRIMAGLAGVILLNLVIVGAYNQTLTGSAFCLPYSVHHEQYHRVPLFLFEEPSDAKSGVAPVIAKLDARWLKEFGEITASPSSVAAESLARAAVYPFWLTRSPLLLGLLLVGVAAALKGFRDRTEASVLMIFVLLIAALLPTTFKGDRFAAVAVGVATLLMTSGAKLLHGWLGGAGKSLIILLPLIVGGGFLFGSARPDAGPPDAGSLERGFSTRRQIENYLRSLGGRHIVFAATDDANPADSRFYVYNESQLNDASIIWAHDLGETVNRPVVDGFPGRSVWHLKNVEGRALLVPENADQRSKEGH